jgi:asparagine synthase (glutamine-hydrolysing)
MPEGSISDRTELRVEAVLSSLIAGKDGEAREAPRILPPMCGIAGIAGGARPDRALLARMAATMENRGPDGEGVWSDEVVGFAFRRLAIIDLHERSSQPMHLGPLHLVFNGEIYNYRELRDELRGRGHTFETEGDAEVLLHAWAEWGEGALDRFNAMFAFAMWDDSEGTLTLAADPFGEKPLYYAHVGGRLVFGSEIKAILHDPAVAADADDDAVALFLTRGAVPEIHASFFRGISRLPAAHVLRWQGGKLEVRRYWSPRRVETPRAYAEAVERMRELLIDSIRLRLRSDVPVGTSLSGGIDSSTIVALSAQLAGDHRRHAFTARFQGFERDEWGFAAEVANRAGVVQHHAVEPTTSELLEDLPQIVRDHEEPVSSLSIYAQWRVMAAARAAGVTVLLDGQGGDELFAGYPTALGYALRSLPRNAALRELVGSPARAGAVAQSLAMDFLPRPARRLYRGRSATVYASPDVIAATAARERPPLRLANGSPLRRELLTEAFDTSLPSLLRYADRSSMAHSREVRLPFLDRRVAELAFSLPASFAYERGTSKRILRDAGRGVVPDAVLERTDKVAFEPPQRRWLEEPVLREHVAEVLLDPVAVARGLYDRNAIEADVRAGSWRDPNGIWRAYNVEVWLRAFVETTSSTSRASLAAIAGNE